MGNFLLKEEIVFSIHITYGLAAAYRYSVHCFQLYQPVTLALDTSSIRSFQTPECVVSYAGLQRRCASSTSCSADLRSLRTRRAASLASVFQYWPEVSTSLHPLPCLGLIKLVVTYIIHSGSVHIDTRHSIALRFVDV